MALLPFAKKKKKKKISRHTHTHKRRNGFSFLVSVPGDEEEEEAEKRRLAALPWPRSKVGRAVELGLPYNTPPPTFIFV